MSRKTKLILAAAAEMCLGAYFLLALGGWMIESFVFTPGGPAFSVQPFLFAILSAACFAASVLTRRKIKELEAQESAKSDRSAP